MVPRVAIQGDVGSFSELAAATHWPGGVVPVRCPDFPAAVEAAVSGAVDWAVLPVENLVVGPVTAALSALESAGGGVVVTAEIRVPVQLCLLGVAGTSLATIREVHSHPVALAQCGAFLRTHRWMRPVAHADTAGAAGEIAALGNPATAAIASATAATAHGLTALAAGIQDRPDNWTRFVVITARR